MKYTFELELSEDFHMLCDIFRIKPETIIQKIISRISFPFYYSNLNDKERWATLLLLDYLGTDHEITDEEFDFHRPYMDQLGDSVMGILRKDRDATKKAEAAARKVMKQWHKAVLAERAKYIIDDLDTSINKQE